MRYTLLRQVLHLSFMHGLQVCDGLLQSLCEVKHERNYMKRGGGWDWGRGGEAGAAAAGGSRGDPRMSFQDF